MMELVVSIFDGDVVKTNNIKVDGFVNTVQIIDSLACLAIQEFDTADTDGKIHIGIEYKNKSISKVFEYVESDYDSFDFDLDVNLNQMLDELNDLVIKE